MAQLRVRLGCQDPLAIPKTALKMHKRGHSAETFDALLLVTDTGFCRYAVNFRGRYKGKQESLLFFSI